MRISIPFLRQGLIGLYMLASSCGTASAHAQTIYTRQMATALHAPVRLRLGKTTLRAVAESLSQQTGQTIECAEYLDERRLTVQIESATAEEVLDQLAELNNLQWTEAGARHVRLSRANPSIPDTPLQISSALASVLPADFRRYLGMAVPIDMWLTPGQQPASKSRSERVNIGLQVQEHIAAIREHMSASVWTSTTEAIALNNKYVYPAWTPEVRRATLQWLIMDAVQIVNPISMVAALNNQHDPYVDDPMRTVIQLKRDPANKSVLNRDLGGDMLMFGTLTVTDGYGRYQGFGVNLKLLTMPLLELPQMPAP